MKIKPAPIIPIEKEEHFVVHTATMDRTFGMAEYGDVAKVGIILAQWFTGDWT
jgi:hypothetical protein